MPWMSRDVAGSIISHNSKSLRDSRLVAVVRSLFLLCCLISRGFSRPAHSQIFSAPHTPTHPNSSSLTMDDDCCCDCCDCCGCCLIGGLCGACCAANTANQQPQQVTYVQQQPVYVQPVAVTQPVTYVQQQPVVYQQAPVYGQAAPVYAQGYR
jgi:hypothetical protein